MKRFDYYQPTTLEEAFELMEKLEGRARYIAGGTDVLIRIKQKALEPDALISLRGIDGLKGIARDPALSLGSMTLLRDLEKNRIILRDYPALSEAVRVLANPQVRNVATIGGNLVNAAPSADCAPPLLVMAAKLRIDGPKGSREVPIEEFFTGPGQNCLDPDEVLTEIRIPKNGDKAGMAFLKIGRVVQDIAVANAAALIAMDDHVCHVCRIAVGAVAPVSLRLKNIENIIVGQKVTEDLLMHVGEMVEKEVSPITDVRSTEEYRRVVSGVLVKRAILRAVENMG